MKPTAKMPAQRAGTETMKVTVKTLDNTEAGEIDLNDAVFGVDVRKDLLHRAVRWQLAKRRAGTHKVKGRSEVAGTTKKPWRQKGTGRARAGSLRVAQFRGGGVVFGPTPRDHGFDLPKKVRALALKTALSAKVKEGQVLVVDKLASDSHKTSNMRRKLSALGIKSAVFIGGEEIDGAFALAIRNLPYIDVLPSQGANVYDILRHETLVLSKDAVEKLEARLS